MVSAPKETTRSALWRTPGSRPSGPPMTQAIPGRPSSRHCLIRAAKASLEGLFPRSSNTTSTEEPALSSRADASSTRRSSSRLARLSGISTWSRPDRPRDRPMASIRCLYRSTSSRSGPLLRRPTASKLSRTGSALAVQSLRFLFGQQNPAGPDQALAGPVVRTVGAPHLLEVVEAANLGTEHVDQHVAGIDQHPVAGGQPFHARIAEPLILEVLDHAVGDGAHMAVGAA